MEPKPDEESRHRSQRGCRRPRGDHPRVPHRGTRRAARRRDSRPRACDTASNGESTHAPRAREFTSPASNRQSRRRREPASQFGDGGQRASTTSVQRAHDDPEYSQHIREEGAEGEVDRVDASAGRGARRHGGSTPIRHGSPRERLENRRERVDEPVDGRTRVGENPRETASGVRRGVQSSHPTPPSAVPHDASRLAQPSRRRREPQA